MQIADSWLRDLPQQFLGQPRIEALVRAFARQLQEVQDAIDQLDAMTDIDTATGQNLDFVGTIIPLTRKEAGILAGAEDDEPVMSDDRYRQYLRYKNLRDTNECTYYDLMAGIDLLWGVEPVYYEEDPEYPATIILRMPYLTPEGKPVRIGDVPMIKAAGVQIDWQYVIRVAVIVEIIISGVAYEVPRCGQFRCGQYPGPGTLGSFVEGGAEADGLGQFWQYRGWLCGQYRVGGKLYFSTDGKAVLLDDVVTETGFGLIVTDGTACGTSSVGGARHEGTDGEFVRAWSESGADLSFMAVNPGTSGTAKSGEINVSNGRTDRAAAEYAASPTVYGTAVTASLARAASAGAAKCGAGTRLSAISAGGAACGATVTVAQARAAAAGTARCGQGKNG